MAEPETDALSTPDTGTLADQYGLAAGSARRKPLTAFDQTVREEWQAARAALDVPGFAAKYDPKVLQETRATLDALLAPGSTVTTAEAEKQALLLERSHRGPAAPADPERGFFERVAAARHKGFLYELKEIYLAAADAMGHKLDQAEYKALQLARAAQHLYFSRSPDRHLGPTDPVKPPPLAKAEGFADLDAMSQAAIKNEIGSTRARYRDVVDLGKAFAADQKHKRATLDHSMNALFRYRDGRATYPELALAASLFHACAPPEGRTPADTALLAGRWQAYGDALAATQTVARDLTELQQGAIAPGLGKVEQAALPVVPSSSAPLPSTVEPHEKIDAARASQPQALYQATEIAAVTEQGKSELAALTFTTQTVAPLDRAAAPAETKTPEPRKAPDQTFNAPPPAPGQRFRDLAPSDQAAIRNQLMVVVRDIQNLGGHDLEATRQPALHNLMMTARAYLESKTTAASLSKAVARVSAAPAPRSDQPQHPRNFQWQNVRLDTERLASIARAAVARVPQVPAPLQQGLSR